MIYNLHSFNRRTAFCLLLAALCFAVVLLTGCSSSRSAHKNRHSTTTETKTNIETKTGSEVITHEQTSRQADTTVKDRPDSTVVSKPINNITSGVPLVGETNGSKATVTYNPKTGNLVLNLTTKERSHNIKVKETRQTDQVRHDTAVEKKKEQVKKKEVTQEKDVKVKRNYTVLIIVGAITFLLLVLLLLWWINRKTGFITKLFGHGNTNQKVT